MTKTLIALTAAVTLALGSTVAPKSADAQCFQCFRGAGIAASMLLGAAGARGYRPMIAPRYGTPRVASRNTRNSGRTNAEPVNGSTAAVEPVAPSSATVAQPSLRQPGEAFRDGGA